MKLETSILNDFSPISLQEISTMRLKNRTDIKFIAHEDCLPGILNFLKQDYRILEINNQKNFPYRTSYFDTDDFAMYIAHHNGKLCRFKIRHREYLDTGSKFLEIKCKSNKRITTKKRIRLEKINDFLSEQEKIFISENTPYNPEILRKKIISNFHRISLCHKLIPEKITIDRHLSFSCGSQDLELPSLVVFEIKKEINGKNSDIMNILRQKNIYKIMLSKYCTGLILLNKQIKCNNIKKSLLTLNKIVPIQSV